LNPAGLVNRTEAKQCEADATVDDGQGTGRVGSADNRGDW
jgi:hypothetical protein